METNGDKDSIEDEINNVELKSASEADTLPMDAKAAGPTKELKTTSKVGDKFVIIRYAVPQFGLVRNSGKI